MVEFDSGQSIHREGENTGVGVPMTREEEVERKLIELGLDITSIKKRLTNQSLHFTEETWVKINLLNSDADKLINFINKKNDSPNSDT